MSVCGRAVLLLSLLAYGCSEDRRAGGPAGVVRAADSGVAQVCCGNAAGDMRLLRAGSCEVGEVRLELSQCAGLDAGRAADASAPIGDGGGGGGGGGGDGGASDAAEALDASELDAGSALDALVSPDATAFPDVVVSTDVGFTDVGFATDAGFDAGLDAGFGPDAAGGRDAASGDGGTTAGIRLVLTWDTNTTDVDVHLVRSNGMPFTSPDDCYYGNLTPDWGTVGSTADDPRFVLDDTNGFGPEELVLDAPADGTYRVYAHFFSDRFVSSTVATMEVSLGSGTPTRVMQSLTCDQLWLVGTITWSGGVGSFTPSTMVTTESRGTVRVRAALVLLGVELRLEVRAEVGRLALERALDVRDDGDHVVRRGRAARVAVVHASPTNLLTRSQGLSAPEAPRSSLVRSPREARAAFVA
jgi:hypothetical protein